MQKIHLMIWKIVFSFVCRGFELFFGTTDKNTTWHCVGFAMWTFMFSDDVYFFVNMTFWGFLRHHRPRQLWGSHRGRVEGRRDWEFTYTHYCVEAILRKWRSKLFSALEFEKGYSFFQTLETLLNRERTSWSFSEIRRQYSSARGRIALIRGGGDVDAPQHSEQVHAGAAAPRSRAVRGFAAGLASPDRLSIVCAFILACIDGEAFFLLFFSLQLERKDEM